MQAKGIAAVAGASGLCFVLGSVHAFSVFLEPLEQLYGASRAQISLTYSIALISITLAVSLGPALYARLPGWGIAALVGIGAIAGILLADAARTVMHLWLGYGVIFGLANGLGYGYGLQIGAQMNPGREGLAMGLITAAYALGATVFPLWLTQTMATGAFGAAMHLLALSNLAAGLFALALFAAFRIRFDQERKAGTAAPEWRQTAGLWLAYGSAVAAGLMAIGHATGIAFDAGLSPALLVAAPMVLAICNMAGSLSGGWLTDQLDPRPLLVGLPVLSALALAALALGLIPGALAGLGVIGLAYGAVISVYPAVIARSFGVAVGVLVYGRVFTAWAVAGLGGPWLAGSLFDTTGGYALALWLAAGISLVSAVVALMVRLPRESPTADC